ncbi:NADPH-dependent diflavin oxidoreductase 1 [Periplaneta americana]|uniref:NADPH-dependent diflavin oxidoreductase 1 n=1 Tax=Periplaneta americana TaxID=6978 RepID=UPI0037E85A02
MAKRRINILYGSQTGTAQEVAERIWRESKRFYFQGPVRAMDDYPVSELIYEAVVVFICSTTGQGEEPDNMKKFWKFLLRRNLPANSLKGMRFAVLGLGDSSYAEFNYAAKKLYRRLLQLGAEPFMELGLADDQHDLGADAVVDPWTVDLWTKLSNIFPLPEGVKPLDRDSVTLPRWNVSLAHTNELGTKQPSSARRELTEPKVINSVRQEFNQNNPCHVIVLKNTRTTAPLHFQDVRLIQLSAPELQYYPGDVLMVCPHNASERVDEFFELLSHGSDERLKDPDAVIQVTQKDADAPVPQALQHPLTLRKCAQQYWDLNTVPRRYFFYLLSRFTTSDLEKEKLIEFTTPEGQEELYNYSNRPRRTILEVLQDFPHATANIPLEYVFELFQPIRPRAFSIASSPQAHKEEVHILVAVVKYQTMLKLPRLGLCSNWLATLTAGMTIPVWVRKGSFTFPSLEETPVIMVGPGTGVAPFRSYIHDRVARGLASNKLLYLFFGCRNKNGDFHCSNEWLTLEHEQHLSLFCAFSRDQESKVYVQHVIKEQALLLWSLMKSEAWIFLAGNSNLPSGVREALVDIACRVGELSRDRAEHFVKSLEVSHRFQTETWS